MVESLKGEKRVGGKTSAKSKNDWISKAYDRINLTVPKGQKEVIQAHASSKGESVNGLINRAIHELLEREQVKQHETTPET